MARYKPMSPTKIAEREAQRKYAAAMRERAEPGPNIEALDLPANSNIEARKIGRSTYARRAAWYDRVLTKDSPGYRAYERLLDLHAVALGQDGGGDSVVGFVSGSGSHELTNDRRIKAGREMAAVLALVWPKNAKMLEALAQIIDLNQRWTEIVRRVSLESRVEAQSALVRLAALDLSDAFDRIDRDNRPIRTIRMAPPSRLL